MVCKETYFRDDGSGKPQYYNPAEVDVRRDDRGRPVGATLKADGGEVAIGAVEKMSKSKNNGVDPQSLIDQYGADTVRLYTMFAAPPEQSLEWSDTAVEGAFRFIKGLWRLTHRHVAAGPPPAVDAAGLAGELKAVRRRIHETIAKVTDDISRRYKFNTAIAAVMELTNALARVDPASDEARAVLQEGLETAVLLLAPIVPHCTEALWQALGHEEPLVDAPWPTVDEAALERDEVNIVVQVNGKKRAVMTVGVTMAKDEIEQQAMSDPNVRRFVEGKTVVRVISVPGRLVNVVVK
jgi:leucyl-tRNA synthetase